MYGVDLDAPPSITPDSTVTVPDISVHDEDLFVDALGHINPLSPRFDYDYGITCYMQTMQKLNDILE